MFTGIVDHCGVIIQIHYASQAMQLSISHQFPEMTLGESICVDGVCLTVTHIQENYFQCDLSLETLQLTHAKEYCVGTLVNLEKSMRLSDRLGGHIVTGHVDGVLKIKNMEKCGDFVVCEFYDVQSNHHIWLTSKGSICVNGVSLTINIVNHASFLVTIIPYTLQQTNFHRLRSNDYVNVEYDYLAKLVEKNIQHYRGVHG